MVEKSLFAESVKIALAGALVLPGFALAQTYPSKPIRVVVPYPTGTTTDLVSRQITAGMTERLGQAIVVENRPGAGGTVGTAALFANEAGIVATHVPFAQFSQALMGLMTGDIHFAFYGYLALSAQIKAGKLKMLAVSTSHRLPYAQQLPTMQEAGFKDFDVSSWFAMYGPANLQRPVVERLSATVQQVLKDPAVSGKLQQSGNDVNLSTPEELAAFTRTEKERFKKIVAISGAKAE